MLSLFRKTKPEKRSQDWYLVATPEDKQEYDAFGPWVYQITKESEMPSRFRSTYAQHHDARFLLKIPVHADRRAMRPGMDLYVAVLAIGENGLSIYRLVDDRIISDECSWDCVAAIRNGSDVLHGTLSILLTNGTEIELAYNNVSKPLMEDASDFARSRCVNPAKTPPQLMPMPDVSITDHFFHAMSVLMQRRGPAPIAAAHFEPPGNRCLDNHGRRRRTTGLLILLAPDELIIITRDTPTRRHMQDSYAALTIFIPLARLDSYAVREARLALLWQIRASLV